MRKLLVALSLVASGAVANIAAAHASPTVSVEIVGPDGRTFREFPVQARDGALRSYLQAEKGARYSVRVRNGSGERVGLVIAVDGRNIINGKKSDLARTEPMYVLDAWGAQSYAGWRANLDAINEFYFTDWSDSYAEAFGDRSARGVIAVAVYREVPPPQPVYRPYRNDELSRDAAEAPVASSPPMAGNAQAADKAETRARRSESAGTGYGDRRTDHVVEVNFVAQSDADSRHFIKYEWRETLCRKKVLECGEKNRFWDDSALGFAPPPPGRGR